MDSGSKSLCCRNQVVDDHWAALSSPVRIPTAKAFFYFGLNFPEVRQERKSFGSVGPQHTAMNP